MGFVSSYEDNLDAKGESVRRSLCQRTKETEAVKAKSSCQPIKNSTPAYKSQYKHGRSVNNTWKGSVPRLQLKKRGRRRRRKKRSRKKS